MEKAKTGLVMEGGALRGLFTAGVIDVFMENGIDFDGAVGVSAGAAFGCNFKSKQKGRVLRYNTRFCKDPRYCGIRSLLKTGDLFGADFCYRKLPEELDIFDTDTFRKNPLEFFVVCTDAVTGQPIYKKCENGDREDLLWFRGSASMPLVSRVVEVDGKKLLDGGISDSVPLCFFENKGYLKNVVILTQPRGYTKHPNKIQPLLSAALKEYPALVNVIKNRHQNYNTALRYVLEAEKDGRALVICPPEPLPVKRLTHDGKKLEATYETGRAAALLRLDEIKEFLK